MEPKATIDFETRSAADLLKVGSYVYSKHPTTSLLCLGFKLPGMEREVVWHPAFPAAGIRAVPMSALQPLFDWIEAGGAVEAHNAFFEWCIWANVCVAKMGWPAVPDKQWRDSAAKAAAAGLPRSLKLLAKALGTRDKDEAGKKAMLRCSKPKKPSKSDREAFAAGLLDSLLLWHDDREDLLTTFAYNGDDVLSEEEASDATPDLSPYELRVWQADQAVNRRGIMLDVDLCEKVEAMAVEAKRRMDAELLDITEGVVAKATQRAQVKAWLENAQLVSLPDTKGETLDAFLKKARKLGGLSPEAQRVIEILRNANRTSISKFTTMKAVVDPDDHRAKGVLVYCGAERTGRWASKLIQVHNLVKGKIGVKSKFPWNVDMDEACRDIKSGNIDWCEVMYGDVMLLLSSVARGAIIAPPGREFVVADYSAIEARVVLWLAGAEKALEVFRRGEDIYCDMAGGIYGRVVTKADIAERQFGKQAILGLGFGMGFITFLLTCRKYGIEFSEEDAARILGAKRQKYEAWVKKYLLLWSDQELRDLCKTKEGKATYKEAMRNRRRLVEGRAAGGNGVWEPGLNPHAAELRTILHELAVMKFTVDVYRTRYPEVPVMWKQQEAAAIAAVQKKGERVVAGRVTWYVEGRFLRCVLPSGGGHEARVLSYFDPHLVAAKTTWGEERVTLRYYGVHQKTKAWARQATYGGKVVENQTQGTARNILAHAFVTVEELGFGPDELALGEPRVYDPVMHTHDELLAEKDVGEGSEEEFVGLMVGLTKDFDGCPVDAEPATFTRYRK